MTISSSNRKAGPYVGNDAATAFSFAFKVFSASDLLVVRTDPTSTETALTLGTDYTVTLNSNQDSNPGGTITLPAVLASGYSLTIASQLQYLQPTDITNNGGFYPKVITNALDRLTIFAQQLAEKLGRSLSLPISAPAGTSTQLPLPAANRVIAWNETATGLQSLDPQSLATIVAFGTAKADIFTGDGSTKNFALSSSPGTINNLDVSLAGVTLLPGVDYAWAGGTALTMTNAPANGAKLLCRYLQGLPQGISDAGSMSFQQSGTGAVSRDAQGKMREWLSVVDFGADPSGAADSTTAIQAAINKAATDTGRKVFFPAGTYRVTSTLRLNANDTQLVGEGAYTTNIYRDFTTGPTLNIGKIGGTVIRAAGVSGMSFGVNTGLTQAASDVAHIKAVAAENTTIADIIIYSNVEGVELVGGNNFFVDRLIISGSYTTAASCRFGLKARKNPNAASGTAQLPTHVWMNKCWFSGPDITGAQKGGMAYPLWILSGESWSINQCYFGQAYLYNVLIEQGADDSAIIDIKFTGCYIDGADRDQQGDGILINGAGINSAEAYDGVARSGGSGADVIQNVSFVNCIIKGQEGDGRDGIRVAGTARGGTYGQSCVGLKVVSCTVAGWYRHGINIEGCFGAVIESNEIKGNNYFNTGSGSGLVIGPASQRVTAVGNRIGGSAFGISSGAYQQYGILIQSGAAKYFVCNNHCGMNASGNSQGSTDGVFFNNWTESGANSPSITEDNGLLWLGRKSGSTAPVILLRPSTTPANYLEVIASDAGSPVRVTASGSDTDIDLRLDPKGVGNVRFGGYTAGALSPTGYIAIKDAGGTIRRLLVG